MSFLGIHFFKACPCYYLGYSGNSKQVVLLKGGNYSNSMSKSRYFIPMNESV